jgi:STE24 endopeptidase
VRGFVIGLLAAVALEASAGPAAAQLPERIPAPPAAEKVADPEAATQAYLATLSPEQKAKSDAYFEGGYWLILWDFIVAAGISLLLLSTRLSAGMRNAAERVTKWKPVQTFLYWGMYSVLTGVIAFPFNYWKGFVRERNYGLATQGFGGWMGDQLKSLAVAVVFGGLFVALLYGVLRRSPKNWWIWGSLAMIAFLTFGALIAPVYIDPLFNKFTKLEDPKVRDPILSLARANGIAVDNVYVFDASRQSKRISANVSGLFGTESIRLNDNLLKRCSLEEIEAVMGHEMGHYVLNHIYKGIMEFGILIVVGFALLRRGFARLQARYGARWDVRGVGDTAGLPVFVLLFAAYFFVLRPVVNTIIRTQEYEADIFGLNASQQPDGFATTALKLSEYRKLDPGKWEEIVFYDHPSGHTRIYSAMRWKKEHPK